MVPTVDSDGRSGFAARLRQAATDAGYPSHGAATAIARRLGLTPKAVSKWFNADAMPDTKRLSALSAILGVSPNWLLTGKDSQTQGGNASELHHIGADVPVIQFATLADVRISQDFVPAMMAASWTICPVKHGPRTFCTQMPDDSMTALDPLAIYRGSWIHVDPDQTPANNHGVLAMLDSGALVVAQYIEHAGRKRLHLLNPAYPSLPETFTVIGRIVCVSIER